VLSRFGRWDKELEFIDGLLEADVRNNSAWSHRYFVLEKTADLRSADCVNQEVEYARGHILLAPNNVSPWNYIRGLVEPIGFTQFPQAREEKKTI
jgi:protein farnesyltransferase/geranylgeranyltransferase type-1 subunit alpha|tara:strand:+ start:235 stop:519 length:285 start_codon:yes stop_codon:yes gene_type:complete